MLTFCALEHQIVVGSCGPVYKDFFFLDSGLLGNSVKALLLISGFPLHFETGVNSALFSYFCTSIVKQYTTLFKFRGIRQILGVKTPLQRVNGNAEYNLEDATVPMFSCFLTPCTRLGTIWVTIVQYYGHFNTFFGTFRYSMNP